MFERFWSPTIVREIIKEMNESLLAEFILLRPEGGDWEALYMDGKLVAEGHFLRVEDVLCAISDVFPNRFASREIPDEVAEVGFRPELKDMA